MNAKQFFKKLDQAQKAQAIVEGFLNSVEQHFTNLKIYEISMTYCAGDGFLFLDSRTKGHVYPLSKKLVEEVLSSSSQDEVFALFDQLNEQGGGI